MASESVRILFEGFDETMDELNKMEEKGKKVVRRCLADFKKRTPPWVAQAVAKEYNIPKNEINGNGSSGIVSVRAYGDNIKNVFISYSGRPLTMAHFSNALKSPPPFTASRMTIPYNGGFRQVRKREPVLTTVTVRKGKPELLTGKYNTPIFVSKTRKTNGQYLPFQRTGNFTENGNVQIVSIKTLSVPQMIENDKVSKDIKEKINKGMTKRIEHHIKYIMGK